MMRKFLIKSDINIFGRSLYYWSVVVEIKLLTFIYLTIGVKNGKDI